MDIFQTLGSWVMGGLRRIVGIQYPTPSGYQTQSATPVTFDSAMQLSAVWACVKLLAETIASLPIHVYRVGPEGRWPHTTHPLTMLFAGNSGKPNRYQTKVEFFETVLLNLVIHGNAYCLIQRAGGRIVSLLPIMSAQVETRLLSDGSVVHQYTHDGGMTVLAAESVWHLKLMGNGIVGMSPLAYQRNTLGIAQAAEDAVSSLYRNGSKPSGTLTMDKFLTPAQREEIRTNFATLATGNDNRLLVLEGGMKFQAISFTPEDIELLKSRMFQIGEICRWYGVPSVMVNDTSGSTVWGSGIEQIVQGFYKLTLRPMIEKIEASIVANLLEPGERARVEVEFDFDALLRSDAKTRMEAYRVAINAGVMTPNECRAEEHLPAVEGGDVLLVQGAMVPITQAGRNPQPAESPAPDPVTA
jgi:HK97 family phage portal protein